MSIVEITDLHFGRKNNSEEHNQDLLDFFEFLIEWKHNNIEGPSTLVVCGDTFDQRDKLSVLTMNYAIRGITMLSDAFDRIIFLIGNHDMFYRDTREVHSLRIFEHIPNVEIVDFYKIEDDRMFVSWIITEEEYDKIIHESKKHNIRFMWGHFEFNSFKMNDHYVTENGNSHKELSHIERIATGHYHMHQVKDNVEYISTPFPYDMNDANDTNRGFMVLDPSTGVTQRIQYEGPLILSITPEDLIKNEWSNMDKVTVRVVVEDTIDDETNERIKESLSSGGFRGTSVAYKTTRTKSVMSQETEIKEPSNIDTMVLDHLDKMADVEGIDKELMKKIYIEAKELADD